MLQDTCTLQFALTLAILSYLFFHRIERGWGGGEYKQEVDGWLYQLSPTAVKLRKGVSFLPEQPIRLYPA